MVRLFGLLGFPPQTRAAPWAIADGLGVTSKDGPEAITILILHGGGGSPILATFPPVRETKHLTVAQINENHTPSHLSQTCQVAWLTQVTEVSAASLSMF